MERTPWHILAVFGAFALFIPPLQAHPHVFVDGGVDFVVSDEKTLEALQVTWLYDEFETLYLLSSYGMSLNAEGGLDEEDRLKLVRLKSDWPSDFDGSAHLSIAGEPVRLDWPVGLDVHLINGRLQLTFSRHLETPINLNRSPAEVAFYESTYFFAFKVANLPQLIGDIDNCTAQVIPFDPDAKDTALQAVLAKLSREETPSNQNVGALFADRIMVQCG
nr:DUF1007 family protein [Actibacterium sp. 188UL27-1]